MINQLLEAAELLEKGIHAGGVETQSDFPPGLRSHRSRSWAQWIRCWWRRIPSARAVWASGWQQFWRSREGLSPYASF
ncbi:MAG: hypothetical protein V8R40_07320 [Dysosmobacter sp.]